MRNRHRHPIEQASRRELLISHRCSSDLAPKILQQGFNRSFCGKHNTLYGKGVYFARDASYSTYPLYCTPDAKDIQTVFLVRVVVGEYCKGIKHAVTPAMRNALKNQLYDSTVDNVNDPSIFVTYHDAQAYPESARGVLASRRRRRGGGESIASRRSYRRGPWPWRRPPDAIDAP